MKRALIRIFIGLILLVGSIIILLMGLRPQNEYTVSFYTDNGTPQPAVQYVRENDHATRPKENPQKDGYIFVGWYLNGKEFVFETRVITEDIVIFAYYNSTTTDTYLVVFNVDGKETQVTIEDGKPVSKPDDPVKEGYDFTGWFLGDKLYNFDTPVERDTKLEARFLIKKFVVTIDFDNGDDTLTASYDWGQTVTKPDDPEKGGYIFVSWYVGDDEYDFTTPVADNITITAHYQIKTFDVTIDPDNGDDAVVTTYNWNETVTKPADPTKEGYDFIGWYYDDELFDFNIPVTEDFTIIARYEIKVFDVTFDPNNGTPEYIEFYNWGETVTRPPDPVKEGHDFIGWFAGGDTEYDFSTPVTENIVIGAKYQPHIFEVELDPANGDSIIMQMYEWGQTVTKPTDPTKEGYRFIGWYLGNDEYDFTTPVTEAFSLIARYEILVFEVEIDPNNDDDPIVIDYYQWGQTVPQPADPARDGHTFIGWYVNGVLYDFNTPVTNDLVIVAQYEILTFDVTIDYDNGDNPLVESYNWGQTVTKPADPTKEGHQFSGWYLGADEYDFTTPVTADITITAHYTILRFEVEYEFDNGDPYVYEYYDWNQPVTRPADPVKEGHDFVAWYLGDDEYDFSSPLTEDITLTARYTIKTFQVEIDPANGDPILATKYDWNQTITKPADPTKAGYNFIGWYLDTDEYDFTTPVTSDIRLTAHYEILTFTITFDPRDGSAPTDITYDYNQLVTPPTLATRNLFTFEYWETIDEVQIDFSQPVNQTITVYPFWSAEVTDTDELLAALTEARDGDYIFITASFTLTADVEIDVAVKIDGEDNTIIRSGFAFNVNNADAEVVNLTLV